MDHNEAIRNMNAERYLLGELTADERDQFEEHYFGCPECAEHVNTGALFVDNARSELREKANHVLAMKPKPAPVWRTALPIAAAVMFASITVYQSALVIPRLERAAEFQVLPSISLQSASSRAEVMKEHEIPLAEPFGIYVDIPAVRPGETYTVSVLDESGNTRLKTDVQGEAARNTLHLLVPSGKLGPGAYEMHVTAPGGQTITRYPFRLRRR
jgi:hypothetical protein